MLRVNNNVFNVYRNNDDSSNCKIAGNLSEAYGTSRVDYPIAMQLTSNGGIIMAGNTFGGSFDSDTDQILIVKTDSKGNTLWTRLTTVSGIAEANSVILSSDGGFLIAGTLYQITTGTETLIIKTDSNGNFLWERTVGSANQVTFAVAAVQMSSGNYLVAGTNNIGTELVSISNEGDIIWTKIYYGVNYGAISMCCTSDGNYVIVGPGDAGQADHTDLFEMKVDSDGNIIWAKEIGTSNRDYVKVVAATSDNGTIIGGVTMTPSADVYILVIKTDSNGAYTWTKLYEGPTHYDVPASIHQTSDGGYIISGSAGDIPTPGYAFLVRTESTGLVKWVKTFQGENNEVNYSVQIANDGGYVMANATLNFGADSGDYDYHLIRTDSTGNSNCNGSDTQIMVSEPSLSVKDTDFFITPGGTPNSPDISFTRGIKTNTICSSVGINAINPEESLLSIFPNPATNSVHLQLPSIPTILSIFNLLGEKMKEEKVSGMDVTMDVSELPAGLYFVRTSEKMVGKFVIE